MSWFGAVDLYCERVGAGLWAEPLNLLSNIAFLAVAALMWGRVRGLPLGRAMVVVLALIGLGSGLFHSFANRAASVADVAPILAFILIYVFAATRDFLGASVWTSLGAVVAFFPYVAVVGVFFAMVAPWLGSSLAYAPVPVLIGLYAYVLWDSPVARGLALGAGALCVSVLLRTVDGILCEALPMGTHFLWHLINAVMLGWMIEVYARHLRGQTLAGGAGRG